MDEDLLDGGEMPDLGAYGADEPEPKPEPKVETPQYVTKADLESFGKAMADQIAAALKPQEVVKPAEDPDWESQLTTKAGDAAMTRMLNLNKPIYTAQIVKQVAGEFPDNVQNEISKILESMDGIAVANLTQNQEGLKHFMRVAKGANVELNPGRTQAPRSGGSGVVGGTTGEQNDLADTFFKAYGDLGISREEAAKMAKANMAKRNL